MPEIVYGMVGCQGMDFIALKREVSPQDPDVSLVTTWTARYTFKAAYFHLSHMFVTAVKRATSPSEYLNLRGPR